MPPSESPPVEPVLTERHPINRSRLAAIELTMGGIIIGACAVMVSEHNLRESILSGLLGAGLTAFGFYDRAVDRSDPSAVTGN